MNNATAGNAANAAAAEISRPIGAPPGPRIKPKVFFDDEGMYLVFTDKACAVCSVGLTSRNRFGKKTLCSEHGRELDRIRSGSKRRGSAVRPAERPGEAPAQRPEQNPVHRRLQSLFAYWCKNPTNSDHREALKAAMQCHELSAHFEKVFPSDAGASGNDLPSTHQAAIAA